MPWARHRIPLLTAALLDAAGHVLLATVNATANVSLVLAESGRCWCWC